jgi:hypothetical protein
VAHGLPGPLLDAAAEVEKKRLEAARHARVLLSEREVLVVAAHVWGFDVWYRDHPVVILYDIGKHKLTIGCPNEQVAERLFGPGGLKNVFPKLDPPGWGGRPSIGGSPRGVALGEDAALRAGRTVLTLLS